MSFTGVLPIIFVGFIFLGLAYIVWKRSGWPAVLPLLMGIGFILYAFSVYEQARSRKSVQQDYFFLLKELRKPDLKKYLAEDPTEHSLYFASLASQALYRMAKLYPEEREKVQPELYFLAEWVADRRNFPQWSRSKRWAEEAFFLAHAAIIIGHYQELTEDETFSSGWQKIGNYLGSAMRAARYKNLISRTDDDLMRPADNAAILYALSLFDSYYATEYTQNIAPKWLVYLDEELKTADSHLPCSAFTNTNTCRLEPTASSLGMCLGYLGAAGYGNNQQLYREWLHYFKTWSLSPVTLDTRSGMFEESEPGYCDQASYPLSCEKHLDVIAGWLAAEYGGSYTYARLTSERMIKRKEYPQDRLEGIRVDRRIDNLIEASIWIIGGTR